ncbi:MAG: glycosyltransferase [Clostridia bacterium]|nr:glycosyltransferase [Clostridia bacterium]
MGLGRLIKRSFQELKAGGLRHTLLKMKFYLRDTKGGRRKSRKESEYIFGDVLFINGCFLPHPARYRVTHQREQILAGNMISEEVPYTELSLDYIKRYRIFIFYRCPYTDMVGKFIKKAKEFNKTVLFDVDDLVIDTKYTDNIPYLATMSKEEKENYDEGVRRMQKTLCLCDGAITTTEALADELRNYVPEVFINRNTSSDIMCAYSERALYERDLLPYLEKSQIELKPDIKLQKKLLKKLAMADKSEVKVGYFSGSITHNDDINLILPVLQKAMERFKNVHLYFVGELDIPKELELYKERIHSLPFVKWWELPRLIASVDINIAPLDNTIFNAAKSENKWVEAALVKVPTIASRVGAMEKMIRHGETGLLCSTEDEWLEALDALVNDAKYRKRLAESAYKFVHTYCTTIKTGTPLCEYLKSKMSKNIAFVLPSTKLSGGVLVVLKHCVMLKKAGYDVLIINDNVGNDNITKDGEEINVLSTRTDFFHGSIDLAVGTLWATMDWVTSYKNIAERAYLVQGYETDFSPYGNFFRIRANQTYNLNGVKYITISKWCQGWLKELYCKDAKYIPDGLERDMFPVKERDLSSGKIRILIEGNCDDAIKNVDESFKIVSMLDPEKYEVYFLSYQGTPKKWYRVDKFLHRVPYERVSEIYHSCDILLKSSILESFSYPPLEMMATGGYVVVRPNDGNVEYLRDGENCLFYNGDDLSTAVNAIERIANDAELRKTLFENGLRTADSREWENFREDIINAYIKNDK